MIVGKRVDPKEFKLPARTVLEEERNGQLTLILDRKSRIIMADGRKIVANAAIIWTMKGNQPIGLRTTAPICNKTVRYLADNNIKIV